MRSAHCARFTERCCAHIVGALMIIPHKRGDTFELALSYATENPDGSFAPIDLTGYTFRSQVRTETGGAFVSELEVFPNDLASGLATLVGTPAQTAEWPIQRLVTDVEFVAPSGRKISSQTVLIDVIADVTRDG